MTGFVSGAVVAVVVAMGVGWSMSALKVDALKKDVATYKQANRDLVELVDGHERIIESMALEFERLEKLRGEADAEVQRMRSEFDRRQRIWSQTINDEAKGWLDQQLPDDVENYARQNFRQGDNEPGSKE